MSYQYHTQHNYKTILINRGLQIGWKLSRWQELTSLATDLQGTLKESWHQEIKTLINYINAMLGEIIKGLSAVRDSSNHGHLQVLITDHET